MSRIESALHPPGSFRGAAATAIADARDAGLTAAAVVLPLVHRDDALQLMLTRRTEHLRNHPGQISFPGGRLETDDEHILGAAVRELQEELGIGERDIDVLGGLDTLDTATGFRVFPVVAHVRPEHTITIDPVEVAELFEVPVGFVLDKRNYRLEEGVFGGRRRRFYAITYNGYRIWGATAAMLVNMSDRLA